MYIYVYICICIYMYMYIYVYISTLSLILMQLCVGHSCHFLRYLAPNWNVNRRNENGAMTLNITTLSTIPLNITIE